MMPPVITYLLKMILCSGMLLLYYRAALYNRTFHVWNRFYLLGTVVISIVLPLISIDITDQRYETQKQVIRLLHVVTAENVFIHESETGGNNNDFLLYAYILCYTAISLGLFVFLISSLARLHRLYVTHPKGKINGITLILTQDKRTPFSFFRNIFWNTKIDIHSQAGNRIWEHEMVHVREVHSADRLLMNIVLSVFWCNPFFWIIRREMSLVHEFIADRKTIANDNNISLFSDMILSAAFPGQVFSMTSDFSSSSLKRRLFMLTTMQHSKANHMGRILILPLLFIIFAAFTLKTKKTQRATPLAQPLTVVIDAGHGGDDKGAIAADGTPEKILNLAIAKKVLELNTDKNIRILLTREADLTHPVKGRVEWSAGQHPDVFISLHAGSRTTASSGFEVVVSNKNTSAAKESRLLGSLLLDNIRKIYAASSDLKNEKEGSIWVLDAPAVTYPAVMVECGNLINTKDLHFLRKEENQEKIALQILEALALFANSKNGNAFYAIPEGEQSSGVMIAEKKRAVKKMIPIPVRENAGNAEPDTLKIEYINVFKDRDSVIIAFNDKKQEKITLKEVTTISVEKITFDPDIADDSTLVIVAGANGVVHDQLPASVEGKGRTVLSGKVVNGGRYKKALLVYE